MGCNEIYCSLCGNPILDKSTILTLCKEKIYKKADIYWLKDCYSLLSNNNLYKKAIIEIDDSYFDETEYKFFTHEYRFSQIIEVHKLCYNIIEKETKVKLKYSDFINNNNLYRLYLLNYINYGIIKKYATQEFIWNIEELRNNQNVRKLLLNPLKYDYNKKRLLKLFKQFKIKSDRKGPNISATLFKDNTYLIGNDDSLWKIKNKKWNKVETIKNRLKFNSNDNKFKKYVIPYLENMNMIGSYNMDGICYNISNNYIDLLGDKEKYIKYNKIYEYLHSYLQL
jgi:hypothetical protein